KSVFFFFQAEDGIRDSSVTGVQTCALPISSAPDPVYARAKSPIAPARIVGSTVLSFRLPGGTISGSCTFNGSLHPVNDSASAARRRRFDACFIVGSLASEG